MAAGRSSRAPAVRTGEREPADTARAEGWHDLRGDGLLARGRPVALSRLLWRREHALPRSPRSAKNRGRKLEARRELCPAARPRATATLVRRDDFGADQND